MIVFFFCCLYDLKMKGKGICEREFALKKVAALYISSQK